MSEKRETEPKWLGETCTKCGKFKMLHPSLYFYRCIGCGYWYRIDPVMGTVEEGFKE